MCIYIYNADPRPKCLICSHMSKKAKQSVTWYKYSQKQSQVLWPDVPSLTALSFLEYTVITIANQSITIQPIHVYH